MFSTMQSSMYFFLMRSHDSFLCLESIYCDFGTIRASSRHFGVSMLVVIVVR